MNVNKEDVRHDGVLKISTVEELELLHQRPECSFVLEADLNMSGVKWVPVSGFCGKLDGNNKTISHLTLTCSVTDGEAGEANMGLFGDLCASAVVKDLHLTNAVVDPDADARYVGILAGTSCGTIENCTVSGEFVDCREGLETCAGENGVIYLGGLVGRVSGGRVVPGNAISYTDEVGNTTDDLAATLTFCVQDSPRVVRGLVGLNQGGPITGFWRDNSNTSQKLSAVLQQRRSAAIDYMYRMGTVMWTPTADMSYVTAHCTEESPHFQQFKAGKPHKGLPYTGQHGSLERLMACLDKDGRVAQWVNDLGTESRFHEGSEGNDLGFNGFAQYIGNDCSGAVYWAWLQVSPSEITPDQRGIRINYTTQMVPNWENIAKYGVHPVGKYDAQRHAFVSYTYDPGDEKNTKEIVEKNGLAAIYESYARAYRGDAVISRKTGSGHTRLLALDPVVIRDADGKIDEKRSYVITHEQGDGLGDWDGVDPSDKYSWRLNYKISFHELIVGVYNVKSSGLDYLPITIAALHDEMVPAPYVALKKPITAANCGILYSNYRIVNTHLEIAVEGDTVYSREAYTGVGNNGYSLLNGATGAGRDGDTFGQYVDLGYSYKDALDEIASGQSYSYRLTVRVSNGEVLTQTQDGIVLSGTFTKP